MSSTDFRQIAIKGKGRKAERLFRAAVAAFCALTRPTRREIAQLEELTLPLFESVSSDSKRYVSAALSETDHAPNALVRKLCDESIDIAAPLLLRSPALSDIDLIAIIGRHGLPHARAIGRRRDLHPSIANLIKALDRPAHLVEVTSGEPEMPLQEHSNRPALGIVATAEPVAEAKAGAAAERVREQLRGFMASAAEPLPQAYEIDLRHKAFARLKMTALSGNAAFFQTALADALEIDFAIARTITESAGYTSLMAALRALNLDEEEAFLLTAAVFPALFGHAESIRLFVERFRLMHREAALDMARGWKAETAARAFRRSARPVADNSEGSALRATARGLKAS